MYFFTFSLRAKRLFSIALAALIALSSLSGPYALSTWSSGNDVQKSSLCSTSNLIDSEQTNSDFESSHCWLCLPNNTTDPCLAVSSNTFLASSQLFSDLTATISITPYRLANSTFKSRAPPKII